MNIQVQLCGWIIMVLLYFFYKSCNTLKLYTEKIFHQTMCVSILCLSLDILSVIVIMNKDILPLLLVESVCKLYIITLVWVSMYAFVYVQTELYNEEVHIKFTKKIRLLVLAQSILIYLLPIGIFKEGRIVYTYGASVIAVYTSVALYILCVLITLVRYREHLHKRRVIGVGAWMLAYILAAIVQFLNNELLLVGFASSIGVLILFVVMENPDAHLDRRIGCFNSYALSEYMNTLFEEKAKFSVMEISFKDISTLKEHGLMLAPILKNVVRVVNKDPKVKSFKDIYSNIIVISTDSSDLMKVANAIANKYKNDDLLKNSIRSIILEDALTFNTMDDVTNFFSYIRYGYAKELAGTILTDKKMISKFLEKHIIETKINEALQEDRVEVFFQPIYSNEDKSFVSAEALVRIREKDGSLLPPGLFIPIAEENGQIIELGERVFELVCKFIKEHDIASIGLHYIEVNLSIIQCEMGTLAEQLISIVEKYQVNPAHINLEITETGSISSRYILLRNMEKLIDYGFSFSLDDFGKGESNLMYVVEMPVSIVKLDRDISKSYFNSEKAKHVFKAVITMAHGMKIKLVAEGIETSNELIGMCEEGIDYIQGYYYSKPLPVLDFLEFIKKNNMK